MRILVIGECMVELKQADAQDETLLRSGFAGDTANTAWYLSRLQPDWDVAFLSDVGTDALSDRMIAFLDGAGICTDDIGRHTDATVGLYLIQLDPHGERSFVYWRNQSAARRIARSDVRLKEAIRDADIVYFSGITLAILPPADRSRLLAAIDAVRDGKTQVVFDPNLRPKLWEDAATMRSAITQAAGLSTIVLPSFEDESEAFGDPVPDATLRRYQEAGAREVVVKNAAQAIHAVTSYGKYKHLPQRVKVVDTTAAGDSFNAGYLSARLNGADVTRALAEGATLSGKVIRSAGALVEMDFRRTLAD